MVGSASLFACQAASQDVGQGFDAELDEHEGLGNQIGAAAQAGTGAAVGLCATVEKFADEVNGMRDGAQGRGVDVLGLFVKFFEQNFESSGHLGDVMEARDASAARQSVDSAVEFEQRRGPVGFGLGFGEILKSLAQGVEGFSARLHEGGEQFVLKLVVV